MGQGAETFSPFYERLAARISGYIGKLVMSAALGLVFLAAHYAAIGPDKFKDWSWFLALLITTAMLALYYATHTLRGLLPEMSLRLRDRDGPDGAGKYVSDGIFMQPLNATLSDRNFIRAGLSVGFVNCAMGIAFGLPWIAAGQTYHTAGALATLLFGFFLAGFVCGMAVWGICGVTVTVAAFARAAKRGFDFTAPDHCGGVQVLGEGLVVFSSVTLIVGVMISVYINQFPWTGGDPWWVVALKWTWIVIPYVASLVVLMLPAVPVNDALRVYKLEKEDEQLQTLDAINRQLAVEPLDPARRKELRDEYAYQQNARKELHAMGTWPHGMSANLKYLGIFLANLLASASTVSSLLGKLT